MKNDSKKWDQLQATSARANNGKAGPRAADDVLIAWPAVMQLIDEYHIGKSAVLDYGCGTGGFCRHMRTAGLHVEGVDFSPTMIKTAAKRSSRKIKYHLGCKAALEKLTGKFDIVTSLMAFHFMEDFESYIPLFDKVLTERGMIVFAVYNPEFVKGCADVKMLFSDLRTSGKISTARMELKKGVFADVFVRSKDFYRKVFEKHGFEFLSSRYPPFTLEFVADYKWGLPADNAEFLIMSVRKKPSRG